MQKLASAFLALSLLAGISGAHAQDMPRHKKPLQQEELAKPGKPQRKQDQSVLDQQGKPPRYDVRKGGRIQSPERHAEVRDYRKRGLKAPKKDQRWVQYNGQYLLISLKNGLILSIVPGRR
jgi:Ni/Co efflux regulator RcnB